MACKSSGRLPYSRKYSTLFISLWLGTKVDSYDQRRRRKRKKRRSNNKKRKRKRRKGSWVRFPNELHQRFRLYCLPCRLCKWKECKDWISGEARSGRPFTVTLTLYLQWKSRSDSFYVSTALNKGYHSWRKRLIKIVKQEYLFPLMQILNRVVAKEYFKVLTRTQETERGGKRFK